MNDKMQSAKRMVEIVRTDPDLEKLIMKNPAEGMEKALQKTAEDPKIAGWEGDRVVFRIAVCILGVLALATALAAIAFGLQELTVPEVLVSLGSASVGALVGLFAPSPVSKE